MYYGKGYKVLSITDHDYAQHTQITTYPWSVFGRDPTTLGMLAVQGKELSNGNHMCSLFNNLGGITHTQPFAFVSEFNDMVGKTYYSGAWVDVEGLARKSNSWVKLVIKGK